MIDIWHVCEGHNKISRLKLDAWRVVEDQAISSTRPLVDSLEEHEILEQEIEYSKPHVKFDCENFDYLLFSPFRYPPLKYGSRFGNRIEPSLWYGSSKLTTALSERAYYRFVFLLGSDMKDLTDRISKTAFSVNIDSPHGIDLTMEPFLAYRESISSPMEWKISQILGTKMRENKIHAFKYFSSRDLDDAAQNVGVYSCRAFGMRKPNSYKHLIEFSNRSSVEYTDKDSRVTTVFKFEEFMINGSFPFPPQ